MEIEIRSQAPTARCYLCGAPRVDMVCHHCGRPMCQTHGQRVVASSTDPSGQEFAGLGLDEMLGRTGARDAKRWEVHCKACAHKPVSYAWMKWLGGLLGLLGLLVGLGAGQAATIVVFLLIGGGLLAAGFLLEQRDDSAEVDLPLVPRIGAVKMMDNVGGRMSLAPDGRYTSRVESCKGSLSMNMVLTPQDKERYEKYCARDQSRQQDDVRFHAGFLSLDGPAQLRFVDSNVCLPDRTNIIALTGYAREHPFLVNSEGDRGNAWNLQWDYEFLTGDGLGRDGLPRLPVQLVPFLTEGAERKALELELQLRRDGTDLDGVRIELLEILVPTRLGRVEDVRPNALLTPTVQGTPGRDAHQGLTWRRFAFTRSELQAGRKMLYVRFANEIEPQTRILGRLQAAFDANVTGLEDVHVYYPWGRKRGGVTLEQKTVIEATFKLELAALRYQDRVTLHETLSYDGVVPDSALVTSLTDTLSEEELYVKWIVENPPRTSRRGAHIVSRYWDIAGRMYDGAFPVDWHLVVTGEEQRWADANESPGNARFDLSLQASVANDEMRQLVYNLHTRMKAIIGDTVTA